MCNHRPSFTTVLFLICILFGCASVPDARFLLDKEKISEWDIYTWGETLEIKHLFDLARPMDRKLDAIAIIEAGFHPHFYISFLKDEAIFNFATWGKIYRKGYKELDDDQKQKFIQQVERNATCSPLPQGDDVSLSPNVLIFRSAGSIRVCKGAGFLIERGDTQPIVDALVEHIGFSNMVWTYGGSDEGS